DSVVMSATTRQQGVHNNSSDGQAGGEGGVKKNEGAQDQLIPPSYPYSLRSPVAKKKQTDEVSSKTSRKRTGSATSSIDSAAATIGSAEQECISMEVASAGDLISARQRSRSRSRVPSNDGEVKTQAVKSPEKAPKRRRSGSSRREVSGVPEAPGAGPPIADVYWVQCSSPTCEKWRIVTKGIFDKFNENPDLPVYCAQLGSACSEPDDAENYKAPEKQRESTADDMQSIPPQPSAVPVIITTAPTDEIREEQETVVK
ncbi:hypothetical protein Pmar_PMAR003961, partial [Perkinsus marinus ATCC 50983]